jgi:hypothetical protein
VRASGGGFRARCREPHDGGAMCGLDSTSMSIKPAARGQFVSDSSRRRPGALDRPASGTTSLGRATTCPRCRPAPLFGGGSEVRALIGYECAFAPPDLAARRCELVSQGGRLFRLLVTQPEGSVQNKRGALHERVRAERAPRTRQEWYVNTRKFAARAGLVLSTATQGKIAQVAGQIYDTNGDSRSASAKIQRGGMSDINY